MKREIKFRVWDNVLNTYHYNWQAVIHGHLQAKSYGDVNFTALEDPELTFEQFTGCLDKNGVEIYEGDIVLGGCYTGSYREGYVISEKNRFISIPTGRFGEGFDEDFERMEVIGNIHENK